MDVEKKLPTTNDMPIFYTYKDKDGWKRTDARLTKELNHAFIMSRGGKFKTCGYSFYPQWRAPEADMDCNKVGWRITADGEMVARWSWIECEHKPTHRGCEPIGNGMCKVKRLVRLRYDKGKRLWLRSA